MEPAIEPTPISSCKLEPLDEDSVVVKTEPSSEKDIYNMPSSTAILEELVKRKMLSKNYCSSSSGASINVKLEGKVKPEKCPVASFKLETETVGEAGSKNAVESSQDNNFDDDFEMPLKEGVDEIDKRVRCKTSHVNIEPYYLKGKAYECVTCGMEFLYKPSLESHMRTIHSGQKPYKWLTSGKHFLHETSLSNHIKDYTEEKRYTCTICEGEFSRLHNLKRHIMTCHCRGKPYICPICENVFSLKRELEDHIRAHTIKQNPWKCDTCGKEFARKDNLHRHVVRFHSGEKPFKCLTCDDDSSLKPELQSQIVTRATGENQKRCNICAKDYSQKSQLFFFQYTD